MSNFSNALDCEFKSFWWTFFDKNFYTCVMHGSIQSENIGIFKDWQNIQAILIHDEDNMNFLPEIYGENIQPIQAYQVTSCSVKTLKNENFNQMTSLISLNLKRNKISNISSGTFSSLAQLELLNLSENYIENLSDELLWNLRNLRFLGLSNNRLTTLGETFFAENKMLKGIWLIRNEIEYLSPKLLDHIENLNTLDMRRNQCVDRVFRFSDIKEEYGSWCCQKYQKIQNITEEPEFSESELTFSTDTLADVSSTTEIIINSSSSHKIKDFEQKNEAQKWFILVGLSFCYIFMLILFITAKKLFMTWT